MKKIRNVRKGRKTILKIIIGIAIIGLIAFGIFLVVMNQRLKALKKMSFQDMVEYTTKGNETARITVGIIKDGEMSYQVYGEDGKILPDTEYEYEIGSLTKTFTATMIAKACLEGKIDVDAPIDTYLKLPKKKHYPSVSDLLTHTSGYRGYYMTTEMIGNHLKGCNDFYRVSKNKILKKLRRVDVKNEQHSFKYSNFGYATLGLILEEVYGSDYTTLLNQFVQEEYGLKSTGIHEEHQQTKAEGFKYWKWDKQDAYISAGAITSNIEDMMQYAKLQMEESKEYVKLTHEVIKEVNASNATNKQMGIYLDSIGMGWIHDEENHIIWHNGGTGDQNSYLGWLPDKQIAVVILSNCGGGYRIPATVMGPKLLKELQ